MEIDESNLTAYALGELSGTERAAVAAHLVGNAEARQYVAEIRATGNILADELARESFGGLTDLQHAAIEHKLEDAMRMPSIRSRNKRQARWDRAVFAMSLAASVLIVCSVVSVLVPFVYHRIDQSLAQTQQPTQNPDIMPFKMHPADGGNTAMAKTPEKPESHNEVAATVTHDETSETPDDVGPTWVPQPDNRLATAGSDREETPLPGKLVGVVASNNVTPTPSVPLVHGPEDPAPEQNTGSNHANPGDHSPTNHSDAFANLPPDQRSPDRSPSSVGTSANGMLPSGEQYAHLLENPFIDPSVESVSGFSAGVDTASYSNIRRFLTHDKLPPHDAVRIEEMLNYFPLRSTPLPGEGPLALEVELGTCPWRPELRLARICLQAQEMSPISRPPVNLVLVVDVSASMRKEKAKLPMLKQALHLLTGRLTSRDRIAIIAYTQEPGIVLPPTSPDDKQAIRNAIDRLESGGQMVGGKGIDAAYELAAHNYIAGGVNRIILATDGNWNIGITNRDSLAAIARDQAANHISLTILGVGMENLKDATLQKLASAGNGSYAYIDTLAEAKKVLIDQVDGALVSRARDVKVQVAFDHAAVGSYRLIGYERRGLSKEELNSHSRPGGELGAGQSVTALYEIIPAGKASATHPVDMLTATVTYSDPITQSAKSITATGEDHATPLPRTSTEFRFAAAVAEFGMVLRDSDYKKDATYSTVLNHLQEAVGPDETGYRRELLNLVRKAKELSTAR